MLNNILIFLNDWYFADHGIFGILSMMGIFLSSINSAYNLSFITDINDLYFILSIS